jgi:hypothetical protein
MPLILFSHSNSNLISNPFTIDLDEIKTLGINFNEKEKGVLSRVGFSPWWNHDFLVETARIFGAAFKEAKPLEWDNAALEKTAAYIADWIEQGNGGIQAEDDFYYKYFFNPPEKLVKDGRILFAYFKSSDFFTFANEQQYNLDFRILSDGETIPVYEGAVYYGLDKKGKAQKASEVFTLWFFREDTQELLLQESRKLHLHDTIFGIGNGFSAMQSVTENIFPKVYPELLGHLPPADFLSVSNILPQDWMEIKERVVIPYILEQCRKLKPDAAGTTQTQSAASVSLEQSIAEWLRISKSGFSH